MTRAVEFRRDPTSAVRVRADVRAGCPAAPAGQRPTKSTVFEDGFDDGLGDWTLSE